MKGLWIELCGNSSLHGMHYLVNKKKSVFERVFWLVLLVVLMGYLAQLVLYEWEDIANSPVITEVENPHYDLGLIDFPAVTICPNKRILKSKMKSVIEKFANSAENSSKIENFIIAMSLMKFPYYNLPQDYVNFVNGNISPIPSKEISTTMLAVMPDIDDMVMDCSWKSVKHDCKKLFRHQITAEGYCISFNSKTAVRRKNDAPDLPPVELPDKSLSCKKSNMFGRVSGLSLKLKSLADKSLDDLVGDCYTFIINNPSKFPRLTKSLTIVPNDPFSKYKISVAVSVIEADKSIENLKETVRNCDMRNETKEIPCEAKCRLALITDNCHCLPHYLTHLIKGVEACSAKHFQCISDITPQLLDYAVPDGSPGFPDWIRPYTNSCNCLQSCSSIIYTPSMSVIPLAIENDSNSCCTSVNVYYDTFAVKYSRRAETNYRNFLVNSGSLGGLLIGFSFVTAFDYLIYIVKFLKYAFTYLFFKKKEIQDPFFIHRNKSKRKKQKIRKGYENPVFVKRNGLNNTHVKPFRH